MDSAKLALNSNQLVSYLEKLPEDFTKADLIRFIEGNDIEMLNFRYVAGDGRLKTLNFVINSKADLDRLLSTGERADGSSLFSYIDAGSSDVYVVPRYQTAYVNPFSEIPTLDVLCSFYTREGTPLLSSPENIIHNAHESLKKSTGYSMEAMGELEYYVIADKEGIYPTDAQKGYHEAPPFSKWEQLRCEAMHAIAQAGGQVKYGHSEVGNINQGDLEMEQNEIEFQPVPLEQAADQMVIAKWMLRMIGYKYGVTITFSPKIIVGQAGSGLHIHTKLMKDGKNAFVDDGSLSDAARKAIAGYLTMAKSLTAFGNTNPVSYLRLVPHQEAPTNICWGDSNRSVLVRVPLGWLNAGGMAKSANPNEIGPVPQFDSNQTVEFRCSDGSADLYLLIAGLAVAAREGLQMKDALEVAKKLYVGVNIFDEKNKAVQEKLPQLPSSCFESAEALLKDRAIYEKDGVFPSLVIDGLAKQLKSYNDKERTGLYNTTDELEKLVKAHFHCG